MFLAYYAFNNLRTAAYIAADVISVFVSVFLTYYFCFGASGKISILRNFKIAFFFSFILVSVFYVADLYFPKIKYNKMQAIVQLWFGILIALLIEALSLRIFSPKLIVWENLFLSYAFLTLILITVSKALLSYLYEIYAVKHKAILVGPEPGLSWVTDLVSGMEDFDIADKVSLSSAEYRASPEAVIADDINKLTAVAEETCANVLVLTLPRTMPISYEALFRSRLENKIETIDAVKLYEEVKRKVPINHVDPKSLLYSRIWFDRFRALGAIRFFDIVLSAFLLICSLPLIPVIALLIKLDSSGPVLYKQKRVGLDWSDFEIIKFRTMKGRTNKDKIVTGIGKILRKTHLDELPQFINILMGDMSIVGPRPELLEFMKKVENEIPFYSLRTLIKPGLTGWAQISYGHTYALNALREKYEYDMYYIKNLSLVLYFKTILLTGVYLFFRPLAYLREQK